MIELVPDYECLSGAVTNKLDRNTIHADHVHLAVASLGHKDAHALSPDNADSFGTTFDLGAVDTPLSSGAGAADLLVVPVQACEKLGSELEKVMNRLIGLAKPDAMLIVSAPPGANWEDRLLPALTGFHVHATVTGSTHRPTIHLLRSERTEQSETKLTNGSLNKGHAVIIEPSSPSIRARSLSEKMQKALQGFGHSTSTVEGISGVNKTQSEPTTYISLLELEQPILDKLSETDFEDIRDLTLKAKRILWITGNGNPAFELVSGFLRVINAEIPQGRFQALHLSDDSGWDHAPSLATPILQTKSKDNEFREKDGKLQVCRIYSSAQEDEHIREHLNDSIRMRSLTALDQCQGPTSLVLDIGKPGLLDTLHFTPDDGPREPLGDHEVEIQVKAAGVNFRDVMGAMGLVPLHGLGQEASGVVLRMGSQAAAKFKPGDRVCTISLGGTYATRARCDARITQKMPESMSFEEAAAVPVIHATVYYALVKLARLRRGQSVLIHAAAGGVGQAAVQLATHLGLVIYVTVGTEDKRQLVMEQYGIPEDHIFHSRDGSFVKSVMRATAGRGVDCVLNSLSGELLRLSWGCVATFGTFVEIGLRDITDNTRLDMRPFGNSTTFTFINLHTLISDDPGTLGEILHETLRLVGDGILRTPSPTTVYPLHQVEDVFRIMQQGRHRGKMVLSFTQDQARAPVLCLAKDSLQLDPEATYLIVGGLGGLGRSLALEFVASGARHLAFISRSGANKPEAEATVQALRSQGAQVMVYRADIAHEESFLAAMDQCSRDLPPIRGVVHMAMVLRDIIFEKMSYADWTVPLGPKVQGSWNIHQYFGHERPLDFIIFCSSTAGVCGNASQAQYAAGNTYQDALARHRRTLGLKATAINLGIMRDVGVLAETGSHSLKQWETVLGIREPAFHALMKSLINSQLQRRSQQDLHYPAQLSVGLGTSDILALHSLPPPPYFDDVRFAPLSVTRSSLESAGGTASAGDGDAPLAAQLAEAANAPDPVAAAATIITEALVRKTAEILRIPHSEIEKERPMYQYGVDSLVALEVRNWISKEMKANMPMLEILSAVPMSELAVSIAKKSTLVVGMASG